MESQTKMIAAAPLPPNDAARIPQPDYGDLWEAFVAGVKSGQKHPSATEYQINRSADAYCKFFHLTKDSESFYALGTTSAYSCSS